jgi:hypothetical protein
MVYSIQNYWVFGLSPSSSILKLENTAFQKLDLFPSSGEWGDTYSVGSLRKRVLEYRMMEKVENPVILSIHFLFAIVNHINKHIYQNICQD